MPKIMLSFYILLGLACTVESNPRNHKDFNEQGREFRKGWNKKSFEVNFRDGGGVCVTMTENCLCNIRETTPSGSRVDYENKLCAISTFADKSYYRLALNCFTPIELNDAKKCKTDNASVSSRTCSDSNLENPKTTFFSMGFVDEPQTGASEFASSPNFAPTPDPASTASPVPIAESLTVQDDLSFCSE